MADSAARFHLQGIPRGIRVSLAPHEEDVALTFGNALKVSGSALDAVVKKSAFFQNGLCSIRYPNDVFRSIVLVDFADFLVDVLDMELIFQFLGILFDAACSTSQRILSAPLIALQNQIIMAAFKIQRETNLFKIQVHLHLSGHIEIVQPVRCNLKSNLAVVASGGSPCLLTEIFQAPRHSAFLQCLGHS